MALGLLAYLAIEAILFVASALLTPAPKLEDAKPQTDLEPRSDEGAVLPVVFGTAKVPANVTNFSNVESIEQKEKVKTGIFSSHQQTVGYTYQALVQSVICHGPVDELLDIVWDDVNSTASQAGTTTYEQVDVPDDHGTPVAVWRPVTTTNNLVNPPIPVSRPGSGLGTFLAVNAPSLFGGTRQGGGVTGKMMFYWGTQEQTYDMALHNAWSFGTIAVAGQDFVPHYEGVCHAVMGFALDLDHPFETFNLGESGQMKPLHFIVRRCPSNLGLAEIHTNLSGGANPAEMIFEVLTNTVWGASMPREAIDLVSFENCALTLSAEDFGLSMTLTDQSSADDTITEILRYIDGQVQQNPITGLLEMSLNRDDYIPANLPVISPSNASELKFSRPSWSTLTNEIKVNYTKVVGPQFKVVPTQPIQDIAAQQNFGSVVSDTVDFSAITDLVLANKVGARTLRIASTPLAKVSFKTDRSAAGFRVGLPFIVDWPDWSLNNRVFRVLNVDYGTRPDGHISVDAVEDIFALEHPFYSVPGDDGAGANGQRSRDRVHVDVIQSSDATTGYIELVLTGGHGVVTEVDFQEQSGVHDPAEWHENTAPDGFKSSVDLDAKHQSAIRWRVQGHLQDGTIGTVADGEVDYDVSSRPARPIVTYKFDDFGSVTAIIDVDSDSVQVKAAASKDAPPEVADVRAAVPVDVPEGETRVEIPDIILLGPKDRAYISALAIDENGNESPIGTVAVSIWDSNTLALKNFREKERTATHITYTWDYDPDLDIKEIWVYLSTLQQPVSGDPWPTDDTLPTVRLSADTTEYSIDFPPIDHITYVQFEPRNHNLYAGDVIRVTVLSVAQRPRFGKFTATAGLTSAYADLSIEIIDPQGLGGTLTAWLNRGSPNSADPALLYDATVHVSSTPEIVDETWHWVSPVLGDILALDNVQCHGGTGKRVYFEFTNSVGVSSGIVGFNVLPQGNQFGPDGEILDGAIKRAEQFATGIQPIGVVDDLTADGTSVGQVVVLTTDSQLYRWDGSAWVNDVPAVNITGEIVAAQIADAALTTAKFAAGIRPVRILSGLPGTGDTIGDVVLNTADNMIYRWSGSAWTAQIPAAQVSGQIVSGQIAALAITSGKIAAGAVSATEIAAGAITTGKLAAGAVTANELASNSVNAGKIQAGSIVSGHINAGAITSDKLDVNSVIAGKIAAGAINTSAIIVDGTITAVKLSISEIKGTGAQSAGILVIGQLTGATGAFINLAATGTNPFISHSNFILRADGSASFSGTVASTSFTGSNATFTGGATITGGFLFLSSAYGLAFSSAGGAGPTVFADSSTLHLNSQTVVRRIGAFTANIPVVHVDTSGIVPTSPIGTTYTTGDLWCDVVNGKIFVWSGGWQQVSS